jgi:hypothetical protein
VGLEEAAVQVQEMRILIVVSDMSAVVRVIINIMKEVRRRALPDKFRRTGLSFLQSSPKRNLSTSELGWPGFREGRLTKGDREDRVDC